VVDASAEAEFVVVASDEDKATLFGDSRGSGVVNMTAEVGVPQPKLA
jgi:hypothetical protein